VDTINNEIIVANAGSIMTFSRSATGNVTPIRSISGNNTGFNYPIGIALDNTNNEIFVANNNSIEVFSRSANGNVNPKRIITGWDTALGSPAFLALTD
jgi:DNA-binding beta-propeller fold protein YncE